MCAVAWVWDEGGQFFGVICVGGVSKIDLFDYPLSLIFIASLVAIFVATEAGRRVGLLAARQKQENISTIEGAILGLLALLIAFTFSMALSLYEVRRDAVLNEANAIGTTALRARLLPAPQNAECLKLLREYIQIQVGIALSVSPSPVEMTAAITRSNAIEEMLWQQLKADAAKDNAMVPTGLFIQSLNEMIDDQEKRLTAVANRVPNIILIALYGIAIFSGAISGYGSGLEVQRARLPIYAMAILVAAMILLIQDLDRPSAGFIKVAFSSSDVRI
jgi:hypothetical protein